MSLTTEIEQAIEGIATGFARLREAVSDPSSLRFEDIQPHFEQLERTAELKSYATLVFAYVAQRDDAGRAVNSHRPVDYFTRQLGMPYAEALALIDSARRLFEPVPDPEPAPTPALQLVAEERVERERAAQAEARALLKEHESAKQHTITMIERELKFLNKHAQPGHTELFAQALQKSAQTPHGPLRTWLRDQIRRANATTRTIAGKPDPWAATRKREFWLGEQDANGGVKFGGYMDGATAAMVAQAMAPAARPGGPNIPENADTRTIGQRRADVFSTMVQTYLNSKEGKAKGLGTIVISATVDDLRELSPESLLPTNTGHLLTPWDIARLGAGVSDYLCLLDNNFVPLALGRGQRSASFEQRLALIASQLCCTGPDCSHGAAGSDCHHLVAWSHGGPTDISNLTLLCRSHHGMNNDARDGTRNMGYMDRDPETGQVGFRRPGSEQLIHNTSAFAQHSAAAKLRRKKAA